MEDRAGVTAEPSGQRLVGQRPIQTQPQDLQPQRVGERLGLLGVAGRRSITTILAHWLTDVHQWNILHR
jgi:hypothetical protein